MASDFRCYSGGFIHSSKNISTEHLLCARCWTSDFMGWIGLNVIQVLSLRNSHRIVGKTTYTYPKKPLSAVERNLAKERPLGENQFTWPLAVTSVPWALVSSSAKCKWSQVVMRIKMGYYFVQVNCTLWIVIQESFLFPFHLSSFCRSSSFAFPPAPPLVSALLLLLFSSLSLLHHWDSLTISRT